MEKNMKFDAAEVSSLTVKMTLAQVEIYADDIQSIQLMAAGDKSMVDDLRVSNEGGKLTVEMAQLNIINKLNIAQSHWMQLCIRVPKSWKNPVKAGTVSGTLQVRGLESPNMDLDTVSGDLHATAITCSELQMATMSGKLLCEGCSGNHLAVRTVSGRMNLRDLSFDQVRSTSVSGEQEFVFNRKFERVDMNAVSGNAILYVPYKELEVTMRSVSGHVRTEGVAIRDGAPQVKMTAVSGDVKLVYQQAEE